MLEERYRQNAAAIHADDRLIDRTLDAAAQPHAKAALISPEGRRLMIGFVCALALIVAIAAPALKPPTDLVTSELPATTGDLLPVDILSDELTLSVSALIPVNDSKLSLLLTVQGDKIDPLTYIGLDCPNAAYLAGTHIELVDSYEDLEPPVNQYLLTIESREHPILEVMGYSMELTVDRYTSGTTQMETVHEIDWSSMAFTPSETGEPIFDRGSIQVVSGFGFGDEDLLDLGGGLVISGFGFTDEGWLAVQSRWPADLPEPTYAINWLSPDGTNDSATNLYMQEGLQYVEDDYNYYIQVFPITQKELEGVHLVTHCILAGEIIEGEWSILVDLTHLKEE